MRLCLSLVRSVRIEPMSGGQTITSLLPFFTTSGSTIVRTSSTSLAEVDLLEIDIHAAGLDLGQIENVVDQPEQVLAGALDLLQVGDAACRRRDRSRPRPGFRCSR